MPGAPGVRVSGVIRRSSRRIRSRGRPWRSATRSSARAGRCSARRTRLAIFAVERAVVVRDLVIDSPTFEGIDFVGPSGLEAAVLDGVTIRDPGTAGLR